MELTSHYSVLEMIYIGCAVVGGILFAVRLILFIIGMGGHGDLDHGGDFHGGDFHADLDGDVHADLDGDVHADSDASFKVLSLQGITAFLLMFGLVGLGLYRNSWIGAPISLVGGLAAGTGSMLLIAKLFQLMLGLQSDGTIDNKNAVGAEGTVYLHIPAGGTGKVQIKVQNRLREYEAVTEKGEELKTGTSIRVVWIKGSILVVEKV